MIATPNDLPDPFKCAKARAGVQVLLRVEDVIALRPEWTAARAAHFLAEHANQIAAAMLTAGTEQLKALVGAHEDDRD